MLTVSDKNARCLALKTKQNKTKQNKTKQNKQILLKDVLLHY